MKALNTYILLGDEGIVGIAKTWEGASKQYSAEFIYGGETTEGKAKGETGELAETIALKLAGFEAEKFKQDYSIVKIPAAKRSGIAFI